MSADAPTPAPVTAPASPGRRAGIYFIFVTLFLDILGIGIVIPVLPELVNGFVPGDQAAAAPIYSTLASVYALTQFLFAPLIGVLSDRFGRRPIILAALCAYGCDFLVMAMAPNLMWLFVGRVVSGFTGATITAANAYIADVSTPETRAQNFGLVGLAFGLGFITGPAIGGLLGSIGLRVPFFVAAGVVLANWLYGMFVLPESLPKERRRPLAWKRANPVGGLLALRRYPIVASLAFAFVFLMLAQRGLESIWVLYTSYRYGWSPFQNGLALAAAGIGAAVVQGFLVRIVVRRIGERRSVIVGLSIAVVGYALYGLASTGPLLYFAIAIGSLGGLAGPAIQGLIAGAAPSEEQGSVQGSIASLMSLTAIVAPLLSANIFGFFSGKGAVAEIPGMPFFAGSLYVLCALAVVTRALRLHPGSFDVKRTETVSP